MRHIDYRSYVGGDWKWIQEFQVDFLNDCKEFSRDKRFLDLGCGSMRLGSAIIPELDEGMYIGLDYNEKIVKTGISKEIDPDVLEQKKPTFIFNSTFDLSDIEGQVDFVWVYQVFIHVNDDLVQGALNNISEKLSKDGVVYATFTKAPSARRPADSYVYDQNQLTYHRPLDQIEEMFNNAGLNMEEIGKAPKGAIMMKGFKS